MSSYALSLLCFWHENKKEDVITQYFLSAGCLRPGVKYQKLIEFTVLLLYLHWKLKWIFYFLHKEMFIVSLKKQSMLKSKFSCQSFWKFTRRITCKSHKSHAVAVIGQKTVRHTETQGMSHSRNHTVICLPDGSSHVIVCSVLRIT